MSQNDKGRQPVGGLVIDRISSDQCRQLHEATLQVLERVGVRSSRMSHWHLWLTLAPRLGR